MQTDSTFISELSIDETLEESFPASDPPSWTLGRENRAPPDSSSPDSELDSTSEDSVTQQKKPDT